jgi:hypothetical protein
MPFEGKLNANLNAAPRCRSACCDIPDAAVLQARTHASVHCTALPVQLLHCSMARCEKGLEAKQLASAWQARVLSGIGTTHRQTQPSWAGHRRTHSRHALGGIHMACNGWHMSQVGAVAPTAQPPPSLPCEKPATVGIPFLPSTMCCMAPCQSTPPT